MAVSVWGLVTLMKPTKYSLADPLSSSAIKIAFR